MTEKKICPNSNYGPGMAKLFGRNCNNEETNEPHYCPYQKEIWDNHKDVCFCCKDCQHECGMDV